MKQKDLPKKIAIMVYFQISSQHRSVLSAITKCERFSSFVRGRTSGRSRLQSVRVFYECGERF